MEKLAGRSRVLNWEYPGLGQVDLTIRQYTIFALFGGEDEKIIRDTALEMDCMLDIPEVFQSVIHDLLENS